MASNASPKYNGVYMVRTKDVVAAVAQTTGLKHDQAKAVVDGILEVITESLAKGDSVSLTHLGRFKVHQYPSKSIPDPRGHGHLVVLPKKVVKFKPAKRMRYSVESRKGKLHKVGAKNEPPKDVIALKRSPTVEVPPDFAGTLEPTQSKKSKAVKEKTAKDGSPNWLILFSRLKKAQANQPHTTEVTKLSTTPAVTPIDLEQDESDTPVKEPVESPKKTKEPEHESLVKAINIEDDDQKAVDNTSATDAESTALTVSDAPTTEKPESNYKSAISPVSIAIRDLSEILVSKDVLNLLPELFARRHKAVPIEVNGDDLTVAMVDPQDLETIQLIKKTTGKDIVPVLSSGEDIDRILNQYSGLEAEVASVIKDTSLGITKQELAEAQHENVEVSGDDSPTSRIVLSLLKRAVREKASDVHIEPYEKAVVVRFRIDGVLRTRVKLPKEIQPAVISRLKILGNLKIDEHRLPQDGRFRLEIDKKYVDFRLSTLPVADGEKAVMRILDKSQGILTLEEIGVRGHGYDIVKSNITKSYGMTLVTGPTGSGKTTTLYALLGQLMDVGVNIVTLEEPIEYRIEGINQSQVSPEIGYTFASGLRAIVRQDPDIIMVGEIRDKDTAEIAIQSALTGHIVLSTLHTNTAAGAIPRLIDMGAEPFLISSSVNTIVAQRLARKLCDHCQVAYKPSNQELATIAQELKNVPAKQKPSPKKKMEFKMAKGCDICNHTGYTGRLGLFEVLDVSGEIETLILNRSTDSKIQETATSQGMITMLQDGILKAIDGLTSLEEVWRVTRD